MTGLVGRDTRAGFAAFLRLDRMMNKRVSAIITSSAIPPTTPPTTGPTGTPLPLEVDGSGVGFTVVDIDVVAVVVDWVVVSWPPRATDFALLSLNFRQAAARKTRTRTETNEYSQRPPTRLISIIAQAGISCCSELGTGTTVLMDPLVMEVQTLVPPALPVRYREYVGPL